MARSREDLHEILCEKLGSRNVYFQPPESIKLKYPCILYELGDIWNYYANDSVYSKKKLYTLTIIDKDPDSELPEVLNELPYCEMDRFYTADNLNHWVFTLYY